jgi:predicted transcriptional regulator
MTLKEILYMSTRFNLLDNKKYIALMTSNKGIEMTYTILRRHIVRAPMRDAYANGVHEKYFLKGILASSIRGEKLSKILSLSRTTVMKNLNLLEKAGAIKIKQIDSKAGHDQNVYILGRWTTEINETDTEVTREYLKIYDLLQEERTFEGDLIDIGLE